jgi:hypothetical protein
MYKLYGNKFTLEGHYSYRTWITQRLNKHEHW